MKDLNKEIKINRIIFIAIAIFVIIIGLLFSYIISDLEDAPGVVLIGATISLVCASFVYGFGEIVVESKKRNLILFDIQKELINKKRDN